MSGSTGTPPSAAFNDRSELAEPVNLRLQREKCPPWFRKMTRIPDIDEATPHKPDWQERQLASRLQG